MDRLRRRRRELVAQRFGFDATTDYDARVAGYARRGVMPAVAHSMAWRDLLSLERIRKLATNHTNGTNGDGRSGLTTETRRHGEAVAA